MKHFCKTMGKGSSKLRLMSSGLVAILIFLTATYIIATGIYGVNLHPRAVLYQLLDPPGHDHLGISKRFVLEQLTDIREQIARHMALQQPPSETVLTQLTELIQRIEPQYAFDKRNSSKVYVCPEQYMGPRFGKPYFEKGWIPEDCGSTPSLDSLLSLVLYFNDCPPTGKKCLCEDIIRRVFSGIKQSYPTLPVHVTVTDDLCEEIVKQYDNVVSVTALNVDSFPRAGEVWTELIGRVKTEFVFIGRNLYHFWNYSRFERQIHILTTVPHVKVVAGAFRNASSFWQVGCYQSDMQNYVLTYQEGYYLSKNECMFCDHVSGPFVAAKDVFQMVPLDPKLSDSVVFADFFLGVRQKEIQVMNCPDVMYYASETTRDRASWLPLAKKHQLNRILYSGESSHSFSCQEMGMSCHDLKTLTRFYLMPPCCKDEFAKAVAFLKDFCDNRSLYYEFDAGSVLGSVKMSDLISWDLDGDLGYYTLNHSVFTDAKEVFEENGFSLSDIEDPECCDAQGSWLKEGYIQLNTPQMYIEMWGELELAREAVGPPDLRRNYTLINIHGVWVNGPPNPGLYARNRYGKEILKHAQSWIHVGKKSGWEDYDAGVFKPCPKHNFHACLDRFPIDGNIGFIVK